MINGINVSPGIDVSAYQRVIDWNKVAKTKRFAIIKLGGGELAQPFIDYYAVANVDAAWLTSLSVHGYWFFSGRNTNESQMAVLLDALGRVKKKPAMLWVDIEDKSRDDPRFPATWTEPTEIDRGLAFADELERVTGIRVGIYTGAWWWNERWPRSAAKRLGAVGRPLWVASYTLAPIIPLGWSDWLVWQTSETGVVDGISGPVDTNIAKDEIFDLEVEMTRGQPRVDYGRVVHVLPADATLDDFKKVAEVAYNSDKQTIGFSYDDGGVGDLSSRKVILWNIPVAKRPNFTGFYSQYYPGVVVEFRMTAPEIIIPPPTIGVKTRFGVNVINGDAAYANQALNAGCTAVSGIGMFGQLADLAAQHRDKTFMARKYTGNQIPPPDPDFMYEGAQSPYVVYLGLNECDAVCYGSVEQIAQRAAWDREMWQRMKARGRRYAGGGFSVGTPDYTRPEICDAMRTYYAPLYNDGMGINYHLYSPWPNHTPDIWYEGRFRFLFEKCGFNPDPNLAGIFCDETGMDQGSVGGFPATGQTATQIGAWSRSFLDYVQSDGYGNLLRAAAIFQSGNSTDWNGYRVDYAINEIGAAAQAPVTRMLARPRVPAYGEAPVIAPSRRKIIAQWE